MEPEWGSIHNLTIAAFLGLALTAISSFLLAQIGITGALWKIMILSVLAAIGLTVTVGKYEKIKATMRADRARVNHHTP